MKANAFILTDGKGSNDDLRVRQQGCECKLKWKHVYSLDLELTAGLDEKMLVVL